MNLILKKGCREKLRKPLGKLVKDRQELLKELKNKEIIVVGDKVTQTLLKLGLKPKLAVVDYKIKRKEIKYNYKQKFKKVLFAENKVGTISAQAMEKIKESLKYKNCLLEIEGEEDLLVLPVILELENGIVCYGQPDRGIIVVEIDKEKKEGIKELLNECFIY